MSSQKKESKLISLGSDIAEDAAQTISHERMQANWLDEIFLDFKKKGGFKNLSSKGKPIQLQSGDPLNSVLHNANILPPWIELQHEIKDLIHICITHINSDDPSAIDLEISEINKKIKKFNMLVPISILQKSQIFKDSISDQYKRWL